MSQHQIILDKLQTHLESLPDIKRVFQSRRGSLELRPSESPIVEIIDEGNGTALVEDETDVRWLTQIVLRVHAAKQAQVSPGVHLFNATEAIRRSLVLDPSLGALSLVITEINEIERGDTLWIADMTLETHIVESKGNTALNVGSQTGFLSVAKDLMLTELTTLKTNLSGKSIKFTNLYEQHGVANLLTNAVTFELISIEPESIIKDDTRDVVVSLSTFEVRCHTAYLNRGTRPQWNLILLDEIVNHFSTNRTLSDSSDNVRFAGARNGEVSVDFDDSGTSGGRIEIDIRSGVEYIQT